MISRRQALWTSGLTLGAPMINRGRYRIFAASSREYSKRTIDLIQASVVIDMQSTPSLNVVTRMKWLTRPETFAAVDLKEFRDSGINVFNWSPGYGGPDAYMTALGIVGATNSFLAHNSEVFKRIDSVADIDIARRTSRIGVIVGLQNSEHFRTLPDIAAFYGLGQRLSQLTYNSRNLIGSGSTERRDDGLSDFGVAVVGQMNSIGM